MSTIFWLSIAIQVAAFGVVARIAGKTRRISWALIALAMVMMLVRRGMEYAGHLPAHIMAISIVVSALLLWGAIAVHAEHRREICDLQALADAVPNIVWVAGRNGEVKYVNRVFTNYTGRKLDDVQNFRGFDLIHPEDRSRVMDTWIACVKNGVPFESEHRVRAASGTYHWFLARAVPVRHNNKVEHWYGTATDIHDAKVAFEKLKATKD